MSEDQTGQVIQLRPESVSDVPDQTVADVPAVETVKGPGERRPIVPEPWQRANIRATLAHMAGMGWHRARYHGLRLPGYLAQAVVWAIVGVVRLVFAQLGWWWVIEETYLRSEAIAAGDARTWLTLHRHARETRLLRGMVLLGEVIAVGVAVGCLIAYAPLWAWVVVGTVALPLLATVGRPDNKPIIRAAVVAPQYEKLSQDVVVRALGALGLTGIDKVLRDGHDLTFVSPVVRDGAGWRVELDLPYGVTATDVIERRDKLASGLRRPLGCVWPEAADGEHSGRLVLYVCDEPLNKARQPAYPLGKAGKADIFGALPFGTDQRGRAVTVTLMFANALLGSIPRMGKTVAMRLLLLAAALDVRCELRVFELKGTGDLDSLGKVAHAFGSGADDDTIEAALKSLRQVAEVELVRRAKAIKELPNDVCPDKKVTAAISAKKSLRLHPLVFALDEAQEAFGHPDFGDDFGRYAEQVIKRGPALGIMLVLGTQRPDAKSLPTGVSSNVALRFALKVMDQVANDMILGTSSYKNGIRATLFGLADKGVGYLRGEADAAQVVKTYNVDSPAAEKITTRARALREAAGTLTGYAVGQTVAADDGDVLADVNDVFGSDVALHWPQLAERLVSRFPDRHADATGESVSAQCRSRGVPSVVVTADGTRARGCRREAVAKALGVEA